MYILEHFYAIFSHMFQVYDFVFFVAAYNALLDSKYFFLTKNLRLVKNFLEITIKSFVPKILKTRKLSILTKKSDILAFFHVCIVNFSTLRDFIAASYALRDLK